MMKPKSAITGCGHAIITQKVLEKSQISCFSLCTEVTLVSGSRPQVRNTNLFQQTNCSSKKYLLTIICGIGTQKC